MPRLIPAAAVLALAALVAASPVAASKPAPAPGPVFTPSELPYPFSSAVQVGDVLYLSGQLGADESGGKVVPGGIGPESEQMFRRIGQTLTQHGLGFDDVFKCTVFLADMADWPAFNTIYARHFKAGRYPARSAMGVNGLAGRTGGAGVLGAQAGKALRRLDGACSPGPACARTAPSPPNPGAAMPRLIPAAALLALATLPAAPALSAPAAPKQTVMPENAEARAFQEQFGFSDAVIHGDTVYLSGVVAGAPPAGADPVEHYARTFAQIGAILARAGSSWDDVLDITTFHTDIDASLTPLAEAKNRYVKAPFPTWTAIGVKRLYEPSAVVEIKVVARPTAKGKRGK